MVISTVRTETTISFGETVQPNAPNWKSGMDYSRAARVIEIVKDVAGLAELFLEAADTERRLPGQRRLSVKSCWPDFPADHKLAFGYHDPIVRLAKAPPEAITRYDIALELGWMMTVEDRKIIWAAAHSAVRRQRGPAWRKIAKLLGMHPQTARRRFDRAILECWYKLFTLVDGAYQKE